MNKEKFEAPKAKRLEQPPSIVSWESQLNFLGVRLRASKKLDVEVL